jgi:putative FmdB family regulatory protein
MPIYIYRCTECEAQEDYLVGKGQPQPKCYSCGEDSLVRVLEGQTFSAHMKGNSKREKESPVCGACGDELKNHKIVGIGIEIGTLVGPFPMPPSQSPSDN